jgi:O-acetyl-ADP-ribose deacetylase (regulator of RNase III)
MVIIDIINGDILNAKESYICHQCNCVTKTSYGLSKSISNKYIWADIYKTRSENKQNVQELDEPGTIIELEDPIDPNKFHKVICFMSQIGPRKPNTYKKLYLNIYNDTYENRKKWFRDCLHILDENNYETVAMPYGIGCGLAGGKWDEYIKMLKECQTKIVLYKFSKT